MKNTKDMKMTRKIDMKMFTMFFIQHLLKFFILFIYQKTIEYTQYF